MNIKDFEKEVRMGSEKDILVTVLVCVQELLRRKLKQEGFRL